MTVQISQVSFPLTIDQYSDFSQKIQLLYLDGTPVILTNYTAKMQVRETYKDTEVVVELSSLSGNIVITGLTGEIELKLPASITSTLSAPFRGVYDLLIMDNSLIPAVTRILQGCISFSPGVTR